MTKSIPLMFLSVTLLGLCPLQAFAYLGDIAGPNSLPRNLNDSSNGISGLDPSSAHGTLAHACYEFPHYVVWTAMDFVTPYKASFKIEPVTLNSTDRNSPCQKEPKANDISFEGYFNGLMGDYIFSAQSGPRPAHEDRLTIFNAKTGKILWQTECDHGKPMEIKEGHLFAYWKEEAKVLPENCPALNDHYMPASMLLILNRQVELDLKTLTEHQLPEARCTDPRPQLLD